ncbi:hypothetical protein MAR_035069 [Mya arenaria]|uniref:Uncharacterized protein n=1 Tax=Mya arenaria TaxID=6604 RepID=A0ABY7EJ20_MYAAR|nr:hypothetical protein MAR_035069 [Mya arenaria]
MRSCKFNSFRTCDFQQSPSGIEFILKRRDIENILRNKVGLVVKGRGRARIGASFRSNAKVITKSGRSETFTVSTHAMSEVFDIVYKEKKEEGKVQNYVSLPDVPT